MLDELVEWHFICYWVGRVTYFLLLGWQSGLFSDFGLAKWLFLCLWVRREVFFSFSVGRVAFFCVLLGW